jgi:hypothetical protein
MSTKKPSLSAALHAASGKATASPAVVAAAMAAPPPELASAPAKLQLVPPSRAGKKIVSGHFDPAVTRQLKQLALDQEATVQALLAEALNDLFAKHGKQRIA